MERDHQGWRIVEVETDAECMGFPMRHAFKVIDEFDEALPTVQNLFWTPQEAAAAIDFVVQRGGKWKPAYNHDLNMAIAYRRNAIDVYACVQAVRQVLHDARELDDNPSTEIEGILSGLHQRSVG